MDHHQAKLSIKAAMRALIQNGTPLDQAVQVAKEAQSELLKEMIYENRNF